MVLAGFCRFKFFDGKRLARQARLGDEEVLAGKQPDIAGDHVAGGELDHIAGDEVGKWNLARLAVAHHGSGNADHFLELGGRSVGPRLLHETQRYAEHDHAEHHAGGTCVVHEEVGHESEHRQQDHQRIDDRFAEQGELAVACFLADGVGPVRLEPVLGLRSAETLAVRFQRLEDRVGALIGRLNESGGHANGGLLWHRGGLSMKVGVIVAAQTKNRGAIRIARGVIVCRIDHGAAMCVTRTVLLRTIGPNTLTVRPT